MNQQNDYQRIKRLKRLLREETGLGEGYDHYFFLSRMGSDYRGYPFTWEPFRDLAGPLVIGDDSVPIVMISDTKVRETPEISLQDYPEPHYQFWISTDIAVAIIADEWLSLLVKNHASHGRYKGPFDWFFEFLKSRSAESY